MAIGVGLLVGYAVQFFGAGIEQKFGFLGAAYALLGCMLGNLLSQVGFIANSESMGYFEVISYLNLSIVGNLMAESFHPRITSYNVCYTKLLRNLTRCSATQIGPTPGPPPP